MFITSGLFPDILYVYISILASVITGVFLFASLMKTGRLRKAVYVSCGSIFADFYTSVAVYSGFIRSGVCIAGRDARCIVSLGRVPIRTPLASEPRASALYFSTDADVCADCGRGYRCSCRIFLSFVFHYELEIPGGSTISLFYLFAVAGHSAPVRVLSAAAEHSPVDGQGGGRCVGSGVCRSCLHGLVLRLSEPACRRSARCAGPHRLFTDGDRLCAAPDGRKEAARNLPSRRRTRR